MANFNRKKSAKEEATNVFDTLEVLNVLNCAFRVDSVRETEYGVYFNLVLFESVIIFGCRIVEGKNGAFISMPSRKSGDRYYSHVGIKLTEELTQEILNAVEEKL